MEFGGLVAGLSAKQKAVYTLEKGKPVRHSYRELADHIAQTRQRLADWGVTRGMRVGIYAPNSYEWLVHDLALIDLGAVSVAFTDDFAGRVNDDLLARYGVALLLTAKVHAKLFPQKPAGHAGQRLLHPAAMGRADLGHFVGLEEAEFKRFIV